MQVVGGIGIRVRDLEQCIGELVALQRRLSDDSQQTRMVLASVGLGASTPQQIDAQAGRIATLASRLGILLNEMQDIAWNGPSTPAELALVDLRDLRPGWAIDVIAKNIERLDNAAKGGGRDGVVSAEDLVKALETTDDPQLAAAIVRVLGDPTLFKMLDTGAGKSVADGRFSKNDLKRVTTKGLDGVDADTAVHVVDTLLEHLAEFDAARRGGKNDGRFSKGDLKEITKDATSYSPEVVEAARFVLEHDDLLKYIDAYRATKPNIGYRLITGLGSAAVELDSLTNPLHGAFDFVRDPRGTMTKRLHFVEGAWDATWGVGKSLWELSKLQPQNFLVDPKGTIEEYKKWGRALNVMRKHPGKMFEGLVDIETLEKDPAKWLGKLAPDVVIAILTAGESEASRASRVLVAVEELDDVSKLSRWERYLMRGRGVAETLTADAAKQFDKDLATKFSERLGKIDRLANPAEVEKQINQALTDSLTEMVKDGTLNPLKNSSTFYSGKYPSGTPAWEVARDIANRFGRGTLDQTGSGTPLGEWLAELGHGRVPVGAGSDLETALGTFGNVRSPVWEQISAAYAKASSGRVVAAGKMATIGKIFVDEELPALLKNPKVTKIFTDLSPEMRSVVLDRLSVDAIKVFELRRLLRNGALTQIDDFVNAIAAEKPK